MFLTERIFALQHLYPFSRLSGEELAVIAGSTEVERYTGGQIVCRAGSTLNRLLVVVEGALQDGSGAAAGHLLGIDALLLGVPSRAEYRAAEGAVCLTISKNHFFTMIHEVPVFVAGLAGLDLERGAAEETIQ